jgi:hypothetical protein
MQGCKGFTQLVGPERTESRLQSDLEAMLKGCNEIPVLGVWQGPAQMPNA